MLTQEEANLLNKAVSGPLDAYDMHYLRPVLVKLIADWQARGEELDRLRAEHTELQRIHDECTFRG